MTNGDRPFNTGDSEFDELLEAIRVQMEKPTLGNWLFKRSTMYEQSMVTRNFTLLRRMNYWQLAYLLGGIVLIVLMPFMLSHDLGWLTGGGIGFLIAQCAFNQRRRAAAYRNGWLEGRRDAIYALMEAQKRGMEGHEYVMSLMERDSSVIW